MRCCTSPAGGVRSVHSPGLLAADLRVDLRRQASHWRWGRQGVSRGGGDGMQCICFEAGES
jgi:hypothetical protein